MTRYEGVYSQTTRILTKIQNHFSVEIMSIDISKAFKKPNSHTLGKQMLQNIWTIFLHP